MIGDFPRDVETIGGGVESVMTYLCEHLAARSDIELDVVTLDRWGLGRRTVENGTYTAHYLPQAKIRGPLKRRMNITRLKNKINEIQPDIVHAHIAGQYSEAAHRSGVPYVLTLHGVRYLEAELKTGFIDRHYRQHVIKYEERKGIRQAQNLISINPFINECFKEDIRARNWSLENPVSDAWFGIDQQGDSFGMLYAGRITPRKDIITLLKAFALVHQEVPEATLKIAGSPDNPDPVGYFDIVKKLAADEEIEDAVIFLGNLSETDLRKEYGANAIFVLAAVLETAPMSIAQAQAAGRLIVSTDAGGCRFMIENDASGFIVPIGDHAGLAGAILKAIKLPELARSMRSRARQEAANRYSASAIAQRTAAVYADILARRGD